MRRVRPGHHGIRGCHRRRARGGDLRDQRRQRRRRHPRLHDDRLRTAPGLRARRTPRVGRSGQWCPAAHPPDVLHRRPALLPHRPPRGQHLHVERPGLRAHAPHRRRCRLLALRPQGPGDPVTPVPPRSTLTAFGADPADAPVILIVEDDAVIREATAMTLERYGFQVRTATDGLTGRTAYRSEKPDVVLLDVMMPFLDGLSLCREIRAVATTPIVMLTARADGIDVVQGLEAGADDYVTKPFDPMVLVARIRAVLRRAAPPTPAHEVTTVGDLRIDHDALEVTVAGRPVELTPTELRLLLELSEAPGIVISRDALLERVWDYPAGGDTRVVDVHVQRLRAKIGKERIDTVRGFGYKLVR
ncbi:MAG: response regulator transcription factor [Actinomycetales bacterium]|nr:response regulator transcription factor [Actinomycetales bacterium]